MVAVERCVQRAHRGLGAQAGFVGVGAEHDAVRAHEIVHRRPLLQELGVRHHREADAGLAARGQGLGHHGANLVAGAHRHGGLVDDHLEAVHVLGDAAGGRQHVFQVGRAVFVGRRAHGDELHVAVRHAGCHVRRELQAARRAVAVDQLLQARLVDRYAAGVEQIDLLLVDVEAEHVVAQLRQARAGDQADIAATDDGDSHANNSKVENVPARPRGHAGLNYMLAPPLPPSASVRRGA